MFSKKKTDGEQPGIIKKGIRKDGLTRLGGTRKGGDYQDHQI